MDRREPPCPERPLYASVGAFESGEMDLHDLRHTAATLLLSRGTHPKLVQHLLGHASITMTLLASRPH